MYFFNDDNNVYLEIIIFNTWQKVRLVWTGFLSIDNKISWKFKPSPSLFFGRSDNQIKLCYLMTDVG